jgi:glycine/D-amino acid oxidase-like deaminating enzyme
MTAVSDDLKRVERVKTPSREAGDARRPISYWHDSLEAGDSLEPRPALPGDRQADVAIVGAGFGGLWTAYYLLRAKLSLRVVVVEAETAGFGASGRNGGWCVPETGASMDDLDKEGGQGTGARMMREMHRAVDEIDEVTQRERIDCGFAKGGALWLASDDGQLKGLRSRFAYLGRHGLEDAYRFLDPAETIARVNATGMYGSIYTPNAAAVHPARLARGIARAVERLGGTVFEMTPAQSIDGRKVVTAHGTITAEVVVRATEAYTASLKGYERTIVPVGNFVIATAPIPESIWKQLGVANRELFEDSPALLAYGQRTADNRIVLGGLGAPYFWDSHVPPSPMQSPRAAERLRNKLVERFPMLKDVEIAHHWGGVLGMTRDLRSSIGFDPATGGAWIGGFGGAGVAPSNLAGRTLADLIAGADTELTRFPWVNHKSGTWEREPLRWIGVNAMLTGYRMREKIRQLRSIAGGR